MTLLLVPGLVTTSQQLSGDLAPAHHQLLARRRIATRIIPPTEQQRITSISQQRLHHQRVCCHRFTAPCSERESPTHRAAPAQLTSPAGPWLCPTALRAGAQQSHSLLPLVGSTAPYRIIVRPLLDSLPGAKIVSISKSLHHKIKI